MLATAPAQQPDAADAATVAVTINGQLRTLLSAAVRSSFTEYSYKPSDTFVVVVGRWSAGTKVADAVSTSVQHAYHPVAMEMMEEVPLELRCTPWNAHDSVIWTDRQYAGDRSCTRATATRDEVLRQWLGVRSAYRLVKAEERRRGHKYTWLLRTRTDIVHLRPLPRLDSLAQQFAYTPRGGMNAAREAACTNDHMFLCPRRLCRAYFELLEIFESERCIGPLSATGAPAYDLRSCRRDDGGFGGYMPGSVATKRRGFSWEAFSSTAPPLIYATGSSSLTMNGPPSEYSAPNFSMPPVKAHAAPYAEHYFLARYTSRLADGTACGSDGDECCGLIRELPFWYTLARGGGAKDRRYLTCDYSLNRTWRVLRAAERADHAVAVEACAVADARHRKGHMRS